MKERPILMNAEMVNATLDDRKTQTRRVMKPQPGYVNKRADGYAVSFNKYLMSYPELLIKCPYGKIGDRLWVRENFHYEPATGAEYGEAPQPDEIHYAATFPYRGMEPKWTPSIHMPRWASRIDLEITDIRVEHIQDISDTDCFSEGIKTRRGCDPRNTFEELWDSINKKRGHGWDINDWVWAISFKRIQP